LRHKGFDGGGLHIGHAGHHLAPQPSVDFHGGQNRGVGPPSLFRSNQALLATFVRDFVSVK
jgi:hypothetical protein